MARTGGCGSSGISAFAIPATSPGISYGRKEHKLGWNSQSTRSVTFDGVVVDAGNRLGEEGEGFKIALKALDGGRVNIGACSVGAAQGAFNAARRYALQRQQFGRHLADFQTVQFKLSDMLTQLVAARQMVYLAAERLDNGDLRAGAYCAMAKCFAAEMAFAICNDALQIHGGYGYTQDYPVERLFRDVRAHAIVEGTNEIMRVVVSRQLLQDGDGIW